MKLVGKTYEVKLETTIFIEAETEAEAMEKTEEYLNYAYNEGEIDNDQWFHNTNFTLVEAVPQETIDRWNTFNSRFIEAE
jgi:hypothetical protein